MLFTFYSQEAKQRFFEVRETKATRCQAATRNVGWGTGCTTTRRAWYPSPASDEYAGTTLSSMRKKNDRVVLLSNTRTQVPTYYKTEKSDLRWATSLHNLTFDLRPPVVGVDEFRRFRYVLFCDSFLWTHAQDRRQKQGFRSSHWRLQAQLLLQQWLWKKKLSQRHIKGPYTISPLLVLKEWYQAVCSFLLNKKKFVFLHQWYINNVFCKLLFCDSSCYKKMVRK